MALELERLVTPSTRLPERSTPPQEVESGLNISVVFTSVDTTLAALKQDLRNNAVYYYLAQGFRA